MKNIIAMLLLTCFVYSAHAQDEQMQPADVPLPKTESNQQEHRFKKENLFTGGGIQFSFSNHNFVIGGSPMFGYSLNKWVDVGLGVNVTYISDREVYVDSYGNEYATGNKIHQTDIAPFVFAKFYPLKFLFIQAQAEQNIIYQKYFYAGGTLKARYDATSLLLGAGYCGGREGVGDFFYYISLSVDVLKNRNSPYVQQVANGDVNILPIFRAGIQVPLFQGRSGRNR